jgi:predicted  nucleic acid-binding Zn-ribbon protein
MMKDSKNLLLILVSVGLTLTWVYHLYDKSHYSNHHFEVLVKDSLATQEAIRDSLQKLFNEKTHELDTTKMATDSLKGSLDSTRIKIYELRKQISDILQNRTVTKADLRKARDLIAEYKDKIEEMKVQNSDLETERQRLSGELTQLNDEMKGLQENMEKITQENKELTETINQASTFIASDLHLSAVTTHSGDKEVEASSARKADKFVFSFTVQNNVVKNAFYDVYVVITEPGNKVLQNDVWGGADYFVSKTEGNKPYTTKIHFEYTRGEKKKILYTLQPDNIIPGTYMMQVYQNGVSLGETTKALN